MVNGQIEINFTQKSPLTEIAKNKANTKYVDINASLPHLKIL